MDEALARQLVRQLKILNIWITAIGCLILAALVVGGVLLFKMITMVQHATDQVSSLQQKASQSLNVKQDVCSNKSVVDFLQNKSSVCQ